MSPLLEHGDFLILRTLRTAPTSGRIVLVKHPRLGLLIKLLGEIVDGSLSPPSYSLHGINPDSISSAAMGSIGEESILAQANWKVGRKGLSSLLKPIAPSAGNRR